jgi:hypothetical protein
MNKTVYIHIGTGKTGTTAIQDFLFRNRDKSESYYYPSYGLRGSGHHNLAPLKINDLDSVKKLYDQLVQEINGCDKEKIIISSEFFVFCPKEIVNYCCQVLSDFTIKVILYVRPQISWIESSYMQRIKTGWDYAGNIESFFDLHKNSFDYFNRVSSWVEFLGNKAIVARVYDKRIFGESICNDFLNAVEITDSNLTFQANYSNESLIPELASVMEIIDKYLEDKNTRKKIVRLLLESSNTLRSCSSKKLVTSELKKKIINHYYKLNKEFANIFLSGSHRKYFLESISSNDLQ